MKKYSVVYSNVSTGYGWRQVFDTIDEIESFIDEKRSDCMAKITVWDSSRKDYIYYKDACAFDPEIDDLNRIDRDYRTTTKSIKGIKA